MASTIAFDRPWRGSLRGVSGRFTARSEREFLASRTRPRVYRERHLALWEIVMKKILPPLLFVLFALVMLGLDAWLGAPAVLPGAARAAGGLLVLGGIALAVIARAWFARARTNIHTFRRPDVLVTGGPFRLSRNPMYLGFSLSLAGLAAALGSLAAFAPVAAFVVIVDRWYIAFEERMMRSTFGAAYEEYARRTRRWL
jgi:protein-S-isoprenylcysteine O-methyltransferase Ste14